MDVWLCYRLVKYDTIPSSHSPFLRQFNSFSQRSNPRVNSITLFFKLLHLVKQRVQRNGKAFNELVILKFRLWVLVFGKGHINPDVDHMQVGITKSRV